MNARVEYLPIAGAHENLAGKVWNGITGGLMRWHRRRTAISSLRALPDYLLDDIGVNRASIPEVVDGLMR